MSASYEWLTPQWQLLQRASAQANLPHAWLLHGQAGLGKSALAQQFVQLTLCLQPSTNEQGERMACGTCASCLQLRAGTHPDFQHVTLPEDRQSIPIDAIRQLNAKLSLSKSTGSWSAAIIEPAEKMNRNTANALLKTLEEPTPNTLLVLVSEQPTQLLATIRSRCVQLRVLPPSASQAKQWLAQHNFDDPQSIEVALRYAAGAPLVAVSYPDDEFLTRRKRFLQALHQLVTRQTTAVAVAQATLASKDDSLSDIAQWLSHWVNDLLGLQLWRAHDESASFRLSNADVASQLAKLAEQVSHEALLKLQAELPLFTKRLNSNAQPQLLLENTLTTLQM